MKFKSSLVLLCVSGFSLQGNARGSNSGWVAEDVPTATESGETVREAQEKMQAAGEQVHEPASRFSHGVQDWWQHDVPKTLDNARSRIFDLRDWLTDLAPWTSMHEDESENEFDLHPERMWQNTKKRYRDMLRSWGNQLNSMGGIYFRPYEKEYLLVLDVPGVPKENLDVHLSLTPKEIWIKGSHRVCHFVECLSSLSPLHPVDLS